MEQRESLIREHIRAVRERIREAAARCGRDAAAVKLMAVTKTVEESVVATAIAAGVDIIGENYVQEAKEKIERVGRQCPWHMIGRLQTNKAKYAVRLFDMIHSVDRMELAVELDRRARAAGRVMPILIEVNTGGEAAKSGISPADAPDLARRIALLGGLALRGLMTMPPWFDDAEDARPYFAALRELRDRIAAEGIAGIAMTELSMGMSQDYAVAVEEGATIVRVGRAIFGERPPKGAP